MFHEFLAVGMVHLSLGSVRSRRAPVHKKDARATQVVVRSFWLVQGSCMGGGLAFRCCLVLLVAGAK